MINIHRDWGARNSTDSVSTIDFQPLSGRRSFQNLVLYYKILNHLSILNPVDLCTNHPYSSIRHSDNMYLYYPHTIHMYLYYPHLYYTHVL